MLYIIVDNYMLKEEVIRKANKYIQLIRQQEAIELVKQNPKKKPSDSLFKQKELPITTDTSGNLIYNYMKIELTISDDMVRFYLMDFKLMGALERYHREKTPDLLDALDREIRTVTTRLDQMGLDLTYIKPTSRCNQILSFFYTCKSEICLVFKKPDNSSYSPGVVNK